MSLSVPPDALPAPALSWPEAPVALIVGGARGIGLALVEALLLQPEWSLRVSCRQPARALALQALAAAHPGRIHILTADTTQPASLAKLAASCRDLGGQLDLVVHVPGLLHDDGMRPEKALARVDLAGLQRSFAVNAWGPLLLAQAVADLLPRASRSCFASLSARVGSIGDNRLGGWYSYRAAKAAQNQLLRTWSIELARTRPLATVLLLHPGTTATDLSQPFRAGVAPGQLFSPAYAASHLLELMLTRTSADSGAFLAWDGQTVPW